MSDPALSVPVPDPSSRSGSSDGEDVSVPPGSLWARMKADPQYAPEHLALEAVRLLGPEAQR